MDNHELRLNNLENWREKHELSVEGRIIEGITMKNNIEAIKEMIRKQDSQLENKSNKLERQNSRLDETNNKLTSLELKLTVSINRIVIGFLVTISLLLANILVNIITKR